MIRIYAERLYDLRRFGGYRHESTEATWLWIVFVFVTFLLMCLGAWLMTTGLLRRVERK